MNGTLVACFSATGNTAKVAHIIADACQAEYFEILPAQSYTAQDLDWNNSASRTSVEMKEGGNYPAIADTFNNMNDIKTMFLGFPVWWYSVPHIVLKFLGSYDFSGKVIFPFVTSGGSGLGKIPQILEETCPAAHWQDGRRFSEHPSKNEVVYWVKEHTAWKK